MITYTAQTLCQKILELREDGEKREAVRLIVENNIDGSDLLHVLKVDPQTGRLDPSEVVGIITLMDSVRDLMRDEMMAMKRDADKKRRQEV